MTVEVSTNKVIYPGNGIATVFPFGFQIPNISQIFAIYTDPDGVETVLTRLVDYSVTGIGNEAGGSITYPLGMGTPIPTGSSLTILRLVQYVQNTSISNQGAFYPEVVEAALDYLTFQTQQIAEEADRSISLSVTSEAIVPVLATPTALTVLQYNSDATEIIPGPSLADISAASTYATAAAASATSAATSATAAANSAAAISDMRLAITGTSSSNNYTADFTPDVTVTNGTLLRLIINTPNTGAVTLNVDGAGALPWKKGYNTAFSSGDLVANQSVLVTKDTVNNWWQTVAGVGLSGGGGGGSAGTYLNNTITVTTGSQALDLSTYGSYFINMQHDCTFSFSASPVSGSNLNEVILVFLQDSTGGRMLTFPASVKWMNTASPSTPPNFGSAANSYTAIRLKTVDSGVTWLASLEGTGSSGGGNTPVVGLYLFGGAGMKANKSSDGTTLAASTPNFAGGTLDVISAIYSPVYSKFIVLGKPASDDTPANCIQTTSTGTTYASPTGAGTNISSSADNKLYQFSNGNIITGSPVFATNHNMAFSSDGGATFSTKTIVNAVSRSWVPNGWVGSANSALLSTVAVAEFGYTIDGGVTMQSATHAPSPNVTSASYANGTYIFGQVSGAFSYKTLISSTTLLTPAAYGLASQNVLGAMWTGSTFIAWTAQSLSNCATISGTFVSRTTAFFTTAGMTGNIVKIIANALGVVSAATDTGDLAVSVDGGTTWSKLTGGNNPVSGTQIRNIDLLDGNFYLYSDAGKIAYSTNGTSYTLLTSTGFGANAVLCGAAG